MKNKIFLIAFLIVLISGKANSGKTAISQTQPTVISENIRFCESTYPYQGGILIANFGTEQLNPLNTEGKGYILFWKEDKMNVLIPADGNLSAPKGMYIKDEYLFICDVNKIIVYHLPVLDEKPQVILFPENDLFINDLIAQGNTLYASVTNTGKIYQIDITHPDAVGTPVEWVEVAGPNGLIIENGTMYIASYPADGNTTDANVIYQITDFEHPIPQKFISTPGQYDGIALSTDKKTMYITNWNPAGVSAIHMETKNNMPLVINLQQPIIGAADITVTDKYMYIPDLPNSRVIVYPFRTN